MSAHRTQLLRSLEPCFARNLGLALALCLALGACSEENVSQAPATSAPAKREVRWLEPGSEISPAQWLVSRKEKTIRTPDDAEVQRINGLLENAHKLYRESPRMIANRTVQIEEALSEKSLPDQATVILADLANLAGEVGQTEGYGAISQHYINMRSDGRTREDTLADLRALYGKRP